MLKIRIDLLIIVLVAIVTFVGCKKPNPHPESLDPIYSDLLKESESARKEAESQRAEIEKLEREMLEFGPRDPRKAKAIRDKYKREKLAVQGEQRALYYEVQAELRLKYVQKDYLRAFNADKPWPNPEEYAAYNENKRLQRASRNWEDRVPKMTRYNRGVASAESEKKKEAAKPSGGGH